MGHATETADVLIVGGGILGTAIGYGITGKKASAILLDEGQSINRASVGNFGLVWIQGKGQGCRRYAQWTHESAQVYQDFVEELQDQTGCNLGYHQTGGVVLSFGEEQFLNRAKTIEQLRRESGSEGYRCQMISSSDIKQLIPRLKLGEEVVGGSYSPYDGHINPLYLFRSLLQGYTQNGGRYFPNQPVLKVKKQGDLFQVRTPDRLFYAEKIVLAAGLGNQRLWPMVSDESLPIFPERGQLLVTERVSPCLPIPLNGIRQTDEGSFMIGLSNEDVGMDTETTLGVMRSMAQRFIRVFPTLDSIRIVRSWAALRILTPNKIPIYSESKEQSGAYVITSHSGVTLAPLHVKRLSDWVIDNKTPNGFDQFSLRRFDVQRNLSTPN